MELVDILSAFIAWLWFWGSGIFITVSLVFILGGTVTSYYKKKRMRTYIGHPIDWLTVMSTARWNTRGELAELMNAKHKTKLFKVFSNQDKVLKFSSRKLALGFELMMIIDDLAYLEDEGYVENRVVFYDKEGNVFLVGDDSTEDPSERRATLDKESAGLSRRDEYRKTSKGGSVDRNIENSTTAATTTSPHLQGVGA